MDKIRLCQMDISENKSIDNVTRSTILCCKIFLKNLSQATYTVKCLIEIFVTLFLKCKLCSVLFFLIKPPSYLIINFEIAAQCFKRLI